MYQKLMKHRDILQKQIQELKLRLGQYPEGYLLCSKNGKHSQNFHVQNHVKTYIPAKNRGFAEKLAEKKYISAHLDDLIHERNAVDAFLSHYDHYTSRTDRLLSNPAYQKLIFASLKPVSLELAQWSSGDYEKNPSHPENLRHPCTSGHIVRSKSEVLIDQCLFIHQIPFRYECALKLGEVTIYPDFTIRHPKSGKFYYWEHFGMMDSPSYSQNAFQRLQIYSANGYIPTINLITSYETQQYPLTTDTIEAIVQYYFL